MTTLTIPRFTRPNGPTLARTIAEHLKVPLSWSHDPLHPTMHITLGVSEDDVKAAAAVYLDGPQIPWEVTP